MGKELIFNARGNRKQIEAFEYWIDDATEELVYGGAKGSGKSFFGASCIFMDGFRYPKTSYFIARNELNDLTKFTVPTIMEVFDGWGIDRRYYRYNGQHSFFELYNGSVVYLLAAKHMPSDPMYARFGSMQFTRGWIEEAGEFDVRAADNLKIAVGRKNNKEYGIVPKLLMTCNPSKNFLYDRFYKPSRDGELEGYRRFVQALPYDNKMLGEGYIRNLERTLNGSEKKRLLEGNWEYDDDPTALCDFDAILDIFENRVLGREMYMTADIARMGADKTVIGVWRDWDLIEVITLAKTDLKVVGNVMGIKCRQYDIIDDNVVVDIVGIGAGVADFMGFHGVNGGGRSINADSSIYRTLNDQMGFYLANKINEGEISVTARIDEDTRGKIIQELEHLKQDVKQDKKSLVKKDVVKGEIGRSPDYRDMMMYRAWFDLREGNKEALTFNFGKGRITI